MKNYLSLALIYFLLHAALIFPAENEKLADLEFRTVNRTAVDKPLIPHSFKLLEPEPPDVYYFPNILPINIPIKFNPAFNVKKIDGFFDFVGNLFSDRGNLLKARNLEKAGKYQEAVEKYLSLMEGEGIYSYEASLRLLAMEGVEDQIVIQAEKKLLEAEHPYYSTQAFMHMTISELQNNEFEKASTTYNTWKNKYNNIYRDAAMEVLYLYSMVMQYKYNEVGKQSTLFLAKSTDLAFISIAYYYRAISECQFNRYTSCGNFFLNAADSAEDKSFIWLLNYFGAWAYFKAKNFEVSEQILKNVSTSSLSDPSELHYLKFLIALSQGTPSQTIQSFKQLPQNSIWSQYASLELIKEKNIIASNQELAREIEGIEFNFPEMNMFKFWKMGSESFNNNNFEKSQSSFKDALAQSSTSDTSNKISFNLGQALIAKKDFTGAINVLKSLVDSGFDSSQSSYHYFYALYHLDQFDEIASLPTPSIPEKNKKGELNAMKAYALFLTGKKKESMLILADAYKTNYFLPAVKLYSDIALEVEDFELAISIYKKDKEKNEDLSINAAKAYLSIGKKEEALKIATSFIKSTNFKTRRIIIDAWNANEKFRDVSIYTDKWVQTESDPDKKFFLGVQKANAEYNMKSFKLAKDSYYAILNLARSEKDKSLLYFYIMSSSLNADDKSAFYAEGGKILKNQMDKEVRYQIVQMMVDSYSKENNFDGANQILISYQNEFDYRASDIQLQRQGLFRSRELWKECFEVGKSTPRNETKQNQINRLLETSACAEMLVNFSWIESEVKSTASILPDFRRIERSLYLAKSKLAQKQYNEVINILEPIRKENMPATLQQSISGMLAKVYLNSGQSDKAEGLIEDSEKLRGTSNFATALMLEAEKEVSEQNYDGATKILLRAVFQPSVSKEEKQIGSVRLAEIYIMNKQYDEAKKALALFNLEEASGDLKERYIQAEQNIANAKQ